MEKRQEIVKVRACDLKLNFGNPRKITKQKREELEESLDTYGDFDIIVINEQYQVLGGNQRVTYFQKKDPEMLLSCKMLIGYTEKEQKYINIKLNTHAGVWELSELGDWMAELSSGNFKLDVDTKEKQIDERTIKEMEPIHYEQYDYVLIACRNELDYNDLVRKLGIEGAQMKVAKTRKIKGRAIWYENIKGRILGEDEIKESGESANEEAE